jgi:hypothetical protein
MNLGTSSLSGFCPRACFPRIAPGTCASDVPLETAGDRWVPMSCGPNVDQATTINVPARGCPSPHALACAACLDRLIKVRPVDCFDRVLPVEPAAWGERGQRRNGIRPGNAPTEWAVEALTLPSNRDHAHVDPTPSAPPITLSAPDKVTVAVEAHAGGLRAYHRCPGCRGGFGYPAAPTVTAPPRTGPRAADRRNRASPEVRIAAHHRAAGADHRAHPLDRHPRHRAAGRQRADHHGWHDDEHRVVLDLGRHQHPASGDRPEYHGRADDHDHAGHHHHAGHHDQHRAHHHHRADSDDQHRTDHYDGAGDAVTVVSRQLARRRWSVYSYPLWACGSCWAGSCPNPAGRILGGGGPSTSAALG